MKTKFARIFSSQWNQIKGKLKSQWGDLTDDDIKKIDGSLDEFVGVMQELYDYNLEKIEEELTAFFESNGLDEITSKAKNLKEETLNKAHNIKETIYDCIADYFCQAKNKKLHMEEQAISFYKSNPIKTLGLAVLTGFVLKELVSKK